MAGVAADAFEVIRGMSEQALAGRLGLSLMDKRSLGPCPCCRAAERSESNRSDKRGPIGLRPGGGWRCFRCGAGGDSVALVAAVASGEPRPTDWTATRALMAEVVGGAAAEPVEARPSKPAGPVRPPADELAWMLGAAHDCVGDLEAGAWLRSRSIDPAAVDRLGLARVMDHAGDAEVAILEGAGLSGLTPDEVAAGRGHPSWARFGRTPWREGWRLLLPVADHAGRDVTCRARWVRTDAPPPRNVKEQGGTGISAGPGVYACGMARAFMGRPARGPGAEACGRRWSGRLVITEGGADWLTWATRYPEDATLGVWSGALGADSVGLWLRSFRKASQVLVVTDADDAGDRYATPVVEWATACRLAVTRAAVSG